MNRYLTFFLALCAVTLATFGVAEAMGWSLEGLLHGGRPLGWVAVVGVALLALDVVLPVPSSVVMLGNGALFGVWWGGLLSLLGGLLAAGLGYWLGAAAQPLVRRYVTAAEETAARSFLARYGLLAIVVSRPVPVLAEAVAIVSGTVGVGWAKTLLGAGLGLLPVCFIYAFTGAYATTLDSAAWAFVLNLGVAGAIWAFSRWRTRPGQS